MPKTTEGGTKKRTIIRCYVCFVEMRYRVRPLNPMPHLPQPIINYESPEYVTGREKGVGGRPFV